MRKILIFLLFVGLCIGGWYVWENDLLQKREFRTFKVRFNSEKILTSHRKELLQQEGATLLEPALTYYPYLLMEVKYSEEGKKRTHEGFLLWGLADGEMVVDTATWKKTHGFEDCLMGKINADDFKVVKLLAKKGPSLEKSHLFDYFKGNEDKIDDWIASAEKKKIIVVDENTIRLHFENPELEVEPHTQLNEWVVNLPKKPDNVIKKVYSIGQVEKFTTLVFGTNFAIRRVVEVFLPVYEFAVQNEDGSILRTYWNALTGRRIDEHLREM